VRANRRLGNGHHTLIDEQDNIFGNMNVDRLNCKLRKVLNIRRTLNDMYWIEYTNITGEKSISMLNLRYVEYMDTQFIIKPFKKG
jgi:hypothetical protein